MAEGEDPRVHDDICGITKIGPTGIEWICIKPVHAKMYVRKTGDYHHTKGERIFSDNPGVDYHHFVNRWPGRFKEV